MKEGGESEAHHREAGAPGDRAVPTLHGRERKPQWQHEDSEDDQPRPGGGVSVTREAHEEECDEVEGNEREEDEGPDRNPLAGHPLVPRSAKVVAPEDIEPGPDQCEQQGDDEQGREVRQAKGSERKHDHIAAGHSRIEGGAHVAAPGGGLGVRRDGRWQVADGRDDVQTARPYGSEEDHDERRDHTDTERDDQAAEGEAYPQLEPQPLLRDRVHHRHHHEGHTDARDQADQRRAQVVAHPLGQERLDQVAAFRPHRARNPHLRLPLRRQHDEDEEDQQDPRRDREEPEDDEDGCEHAAGQLRELDCVLLQWVDRVRLQLERPRQLLLDHVRSLQAAPHAAHVRDRDEVCVLAAAEDFAEEVEVDRASGELCGAELEGAAEEAVRRDRDDLHLHRPALEQQDEGVPDLTVDLRGEVHVDRDLVPLQQHHPPCASRSEPKGWASDVS